MTHSKKICKILKEIRRQIAEKNDIALVTSECHYKGECKGTCPKCEAEVRFLENELMKRRQLGKAVAIAGISLGMVGSFTDCSAPQKTDNASSNVNIGTDTITDTNNVFISNTKIGTDTTIPTFKIDELEGIVLVGLIDDDLDFPDVLRYTEEMPEPIGGIDILYEFLTSEIKYPKIDINRLGSDAVFVEFIVEEDGSISNVKMLEGFSFEIDQEIIRAVEMMPKWKPGKEKGESVRCFYTILIRFTLEDK
jgi:hypothetical protein